MNRSDIRLKILELTRSASPNPDIEAWIGRAARLEAWVNPVGQGVSPPQKRGPGRPPKMMAGEDATEDRGP